MTQETELRRLQQRLSIHNEEKEVIAKKWQEQKDSKAKQGESYQSIIKSLLTSIKGYQKYLEVVERSFVNSYENLLLTVDFKFDAVREASTEIMKIQLDSKEKKLLPTHSLSLIDVINEHSQTVNYTELDKIFNKTIKDLRGRKFLDEKEANALFENVLGTGQQSKDMNNSGMSGKQSRES